MTRVCIGVEWGLRENMGRLSERSLVPDGEKHWIRSRSCEAGDKKTLTANAPMIRLIFPSPR